jgi:phosphoglycolate phosphatase-like HAD superfamily hydrolase
MFQEMRSAVNIPADKDILDHIHSLPDREQATAFSKIQAIERQAMADQVPQPGLVSLMEYLDRKGIRKAICTRNFDAPVEHFLKNHVPSHLKPFGPIITRDFRPPKPSPAGILHIAHSWGVVGSAVVPTTPRSERLLPLIMVGDSIDDMVSGHEAGALTVLLRSEGKEELENDDHTDVAISR